MREDSPAVQQGAMHLERNTAGQQVMLGAERLESSFAEHEFPVLV